MILVRSFELVDPRTGNTVTWTADVREAISPHTMLELIERLGGTEDGELS